MSASPITESVTVWHFLAENEDGAVWHPTVYEGAVTTSERTEEVRMSRHGVARLCGFLFPTGHLLPVTPAVGRDCIARGDYGACESPDAARETGAAVYCFAEVIRPPRLSGGSLVEWVQFSADAVV